MKTFYSSDQVKVPGRGLVFLVEMEPWDKVAVGEVVLLDGEEREIVGVERALNLMDPPFPSRNVGLLTRKVG